MSGLSARKKSIFSKLTPKCRMEPMTNDIQRNSIQGFCGQGRRSIFVNCSPWIILECPTVGKDWDFSALPNTNYAQRFYFCVVACVMSFWFRHLCFDPETMKASFCPGPATVTLVLLVIVEINDEPLLYIWWELHFRFFFQNLLSFKKMSKVAMAGKTKKI